MNVKPAVFGLVAIAGAVCLSSEAYGQSSAGPCADKDFPAPNLCRRARLDSLHASYLLLVDESGSMKPLWPAVRQALAEFSAAIPDGDDLEVRLFSACPHTLIPPTPASERTRSAWQQQISGLGEPSGTSTDLGCAAEAIIEQLRSAPAGRLQFVFVLTDGQHQPSAGEASRRYPPVWGGNWPELAKQGEILLRRGHPAAVTLLRLKHDADRSFLSRVFPDLVVTDAIGPDALRSWFANARRRVSVSKLRLLVDQELKNPAWVVKGADEIAAQTGRSSTHEVVVRPERSIVTTRLASLGSVAMPGGGSIEFIDSMPTDSANQVRVRISGGDCAWWRPPGSCGVMGRGYARLTTKLDPADELTRIGIDPGARPDSVVMELAIATGGALPWHLYYPLATLLLALIVAALVRAKWAAHQPYLTGRVLLRFPKESGADIASVEPQVVNLAQPRQRAYSVIDPLGREILRFEARNERGRTKIYASPSGEPVRVGGKRLATAQPVTRTTRFETDHGEMQYFTS
jgi:hypothetical protein